MNNVLFKFLIIITFSLHPPACLNVLWTTRLRFFPLWPSLNFFVYTPNVREQPSRLPSPPYSPPPSLQWLLGVTLIHLILGGYFFFFDNFINRRSPVTINSLLITLKGLCVWSPQWKGLYLSMDSFPFTQSPIQNDNVDVYSAWNVNIFKP